jgi:hypothetical protein
MFLPVGYCAHVIQVAYTELTLARDWGLKIKLQSYLEVSQNCYLFLLYWTKSEYRASNYNTTNEQITGTDVKGKGRSTIYVLLGISLELLWKTKKTSLSTAGLSLEIWTLVIANTKQGANHSTAMPCTVNCQAQYETVQAVKLEHHKTGHYTQTARESIPVCGKPLRHWLLITRTEDSYKTGTSHRRTLSDWEAEPHTVLRIK